MSGEERKKKRILPLHLDSNVDRRETWRVVTLVIGRIVRITLRRSSRHTEVVHGVHCTLAQYVHLECGLCHGLVVARGVASSSFCKIQSLNIKSRNKNIVYTPAFSFSNRACSSCIFFLISLTVSFLVERSPFSSSSVCSTRRAEVRPLILLLGIAVAIVWGVGGQGAAQGGAGEARKRRPLEARAQDVPTCQLSGY